MPRSRFVAQLAFVGLTVFGGDVSGQAYPSKLIRIVTSAAGGGTDTTARLVARGLSGLGQPVIVENRGGSTLAREMVSKAPPDGYTLLVAAATLWTAPLLLRVPNDPVRDFSPISITTSSPSILVVHPSLPTRSVKELIALARAKPGELNYGDGGIGGSLWMAGVLFDQMTGVKIVHVPYTGAEKALTGLLGGEVHLVFSSPSPVIPLIKSGRLRALGVTSLKPSALAPGLPAIATSVPGYESISMDGLWAPAGTPATIINRLNQEIVRFLNTATVKEEIFSTGSEAVGSSPEEFAAAVRSEITKLERFIKDLGIKTN